jgi:hypothetical protein
VGRAARAEVGVESENGDGVEESIYWKREGFSQETADFVVCLMQRREKAA